ncbi:hypothetical protein ZWY2020_044158 [Hordeum vulgare]|nr:hypothetical protein ZWY2020_044158 [Hordeum vulgare]
MAEGFGRWESDPLFPAAECVQDSADRMEGVYRLLLHEKKVIQDDASDAKLHAPIQYERDVTTALGTTKWQLEQFEREVNAAAFADKSTSRENAILKFRQFIRAIAEQISEVEESLKTLRTDFSRTPKSPYSSSEQDGDGLASFLSGGNTHSHAYYSTDTDEITELKIDSPPMVNGYHSAQEHTTHELRYSGNDLEGASKLQYHNGSTLYSLDAGDSLGTSHRYKNKLSSQYRGFMRNLWFTNRDHESFTKRRKDGEVVDGLRNGNILPPFNLRTSGRTIYCWPELIKRTLSRSEYSTRYSHPQLFVATSLLVALAVLARGSPASVSVPVAGSGPWAVPRRVHAEEEPPPNLNQSLHHGRKLNSARAMIPSLSTEEREICSRSMAFRPSSQPRPTAREEGRGACPGGSQGQRAVRAPLAPINKTPCACWPPHHPPPHTTISRSQSPTGRRLHLPPRDQRTPQPSPPLPPPVSPRRPRGARCQPPLLQGVLC